MQLLNYGITFTHTLPAFSLATALSGALLADNISCRAWKIMNEA